MIARSFLLTLGLASAFSLFGNGINLDTGIAPWTVYVPGTGSVNVINVAANGAWAAAPTGSSWVSYGASQSTDCGSGQTAGNGCASNLISAGGDVFTYSLSISAASLGSTSGVLNFVFGADNRVNLFVGNNSQGEFLNNGTPTNGNAYNPLGCSGVPPTNAGSSNPYTCASSVSFDASNLNLDGSLTITAYVTNDPSNTNGNPTGFVLAGTALTGADVTPEPATFGLVTLAGLAGFAIRRFKNRS